MRKLPQLENASSVCLAEAVHGAKSHKEIMLPALAGIDVDIRSSGPEIAHATAQAPLGLQPDFQAETNLQQSSGR